MSLIRPYQPADREALYDLCLRTASGGTGVQGRVTNDDLLGDVFAGPYVDHDPALVLMVEDDEGPVGYLVGTADTREFVRWFTAERLPGFAAKYADVDPDSFEAGYVESGLHPERMLVPEVDAYPPHLHMNLLARARRQGFGRQLLVGFAGLLLDRGIERFHLTPSTSNPGSLRFYEAVGFAYLDSSTPRAPVLGIECRVLVP